MKRILESCAGTLFALAIYVAVSSSIQDGYIRLHNNGLHIGPPPMMSCNGTSCSIHNPLQPHDSWEGGHDYFVPDSPTSVEPMVETIPNVCRRFGRTWEDGRPQWCI